MNVTRIGVGVVAALIGLPAGARAQTAATVREIVRVFVQERQAVSKDAPLVQLDDRQVRLQALVVDRRPVRQVPPLDRQVQVRPVRQREVLLDRTFSVRRSR